MEKEVTLILVIFLSTSLGLWYILLDQDWAASKNQLFVSVLLSPSILIITWAISNNLALSLGMIGALSIVLFRNPVKNPAELSIYFVAAYILANLDTIIISNIGSFILHGEKMCRRQSAITDRSCMCGATPAQWGSLVGRTHSRRRVDRRAPACPISRSA